MQWLIRLIWILISWKGNLFKQSFQFLNFQLPDQFFIIIYDCLLYFLVLPPAVMWHFRTVCDPAAVSNKDDRVGSVECKMVQSGLLPLHYRLDTDRVLEQGAQITSHTLSTSVRPIAILSKLPCDCKSKWNIGWLMSLLRILTSISEAQGMKTLVRKMFQQMLCTGVLWAK